MKINDWTNIQHAIGQLQGMADILDMTEEVDLKKLKEGLREIAGKLKTIADEELSKLEDVQKKEPPKPIQKKPQQKKPAVKPEVKP